MKIYHYKYNEIFIIESLLYEERLANAYNDLFDELLLSRNSSTKEIYESFNIPNHKITSAPHVVKALLLKKKLPAFKFLACKN